MRKRQWTDFGLAVKRKLLETGQTQKWLIGAVGEVVDQYVDSSNLYKIMTGQIKSPVIEEAICKVLCLEKGAEQDDL